MRRYYLMVSVSHYSINIRLVVTLWVMLLWLVLPIKAHAMDSEDFGFVTPNSVEGTLNATENRQSEGVLQGYLAWKKQFADRTGLSFGIDDQVLVLDTNSDRSPSNAATNVFRFYGTWAAKGRGTPDNGALVWKLENRSAIGDRISAQALGPSLGYAGLFASTYSDAGWLLTNLYWRQRYAAGRVSFVIGQVDPGDYVNVNSIASPWTGFTNLAFEQQPILPLPSQGLGGAIQWMLNENWGILGGIADANADPSDPIDSAEKLFDTGETFKHFAIGWTPDWSDRHDQSLQLTFWHVDERKEADVEEGHGAALLASARIDNWRPFLRAGYADGGGAILDRAISIGTGYDARGGKDLAGVGLGWGRAPGSDRNQYSMELFYRYDLNDFLQITPSFQYVANPAYDLAADNILVFGLRVRMAF